MKKQSSLKPSQEPHNVLALLNLEELNEKDYFKTKVYKKHEYIYLPGEIADRIFIIKEGRVKIGNHHDYSKEIIKNVLLKGEYFGEFSMIGQNSRADFAIAMEPTELYILSKEQFQDLLRKSNDLMLYMMSSLGTRLMNMETGYPNLK